MTTGIGGHVPNPLPLKDKANSTALRVSGSRKTGPLKGGAAASNANCLGGSSGAGFGWKSVDVFKLGVQYVLNQQWTLRAGYNHTTNPITSENVSFNVLAPGVVQDHITLGTTYNLSPRSELTGAFMYAFNNEVTGPSFFNALFFFKTSNTTEKIEMWQWSLGVQYSYKF